MFTFIQALLVVFSLALVAKVIHARKSKEDPQA